MTDREIAYMINQAIELLYDNDAWLLEHDLSEQSISHRFAMYLQDLFPAYHVDCEYNGNWMDYSGKKKIIIIKERLENIGGLKPREFDDIENEFTERAVFPDIIIHKRGTNESNKCIIEVKKSTSRISRDYDQIKLSSYTSKEDGNSLCYQIGIFINFRTGRGAGNHEIVYYKNGIEEALE